MSEQLVDDPVSQECLHWQAGLQAEIDQYFDAAHARVEAVYRAEFSSLSSVLRRHWQCWRDIPADLAAFPRAVWRLLARMLGRASVQRRLTAKEQRVAALLAEQVLQLDRLEDVLLEHLKTHPQYKDGDAAELRLPALVGYGPGLAAERVQQAVARWGLSHDSSRDMVLFLGLGVLGRGLSDKVLFGSASLVGIVLASSIYLDHAGWFENLWASWFGVPIWVKSAGIVLGFSLAWLLTPLLAPLIEWCFNHLWSRRRLHRMVDEVHCELRPPIQDRIWSYGAYLQFIPDVLTLLRQMR